MSSSGTASPQLQSLAERVSLRMSRQRTTGTAPELALRRLLHARGLRFFVERPIVTGTRRRVDVVFPGVRVAVDVRGCFWHGCVEHRLVLALGAIIAIGVVVVKSSGDDDSPRTPTPFIRPAVNAPLGGRDVDCVDIGHEVSVGAYEPNGLDRENDGIGCEGW